ncbi:MAG TPA: F0F1 ATP synthase subunit gamma, partial [Candidatus Paceibacterota bacterium]|nr:F0F1 ATP synthase subunit gamma [Candidatus Paceibacterota bacterium]
MAGLKTIKGKIRSVEKTKKVTKAMEAVSAAKMRKAQNRALAGRAYARAAVSILARASGSRELLSHPLTEKRAVNKALYIVITSDKGLAGALNSAVLRATLSDISKAGLSRENVSVLAVGRKSHDFFAVRGYKVETYHQNTDHIDSKLIRELVDLAAKHYSSKAADTVKIAYQNFFSTFEQRPTLRTIFPLSIEELEKVVSDILPVRGALAKNT